MKENLTLDSKEDTISELELYKKAGGWTICDIAPKGLRSACWPDVLYGLLLNRSCNRYSPELVPEISRASGVKIVAGTAYYVDPLHS